MALEHICAKSRRGRAPIPGSLRVSRSQPGFGRAESQRKHGSSHPRRPYCRRSLNAERSGCAARPNGCERSRWAEQRNQHRLHMECRIRAGLTVRNYGFFIDTTCYNQPGCFIPEVHYPASQRPSSRPPPMPHWRLTPTPITEVSTTIFPITIATKSGSASSMRTTPAADCLRSVSSGSCTITPEVLAPQWTWSTLRS